MILTCPNCGTQYVVKDGAIPPGGRQVRCASCKHSWHEHPEGDGDSAPPITAALGTQSAELDEPTSSVEPAFEESAPDDDVDGVEEEQSFAEATLIDPRSGPEAEERAFEEAAIEASDEADVSAEAPGNSNPDRVPVEAAVPAYSGAAVHDDEFTPFPMADDDDADGSRSPLLTILLIVIAVAAIAAAFWFFAPDALKVRLGLAAAGASPLALVTTHMDRQRLQSGNELLTVTGRVINPTGSEQQVPPLQAQLRSRSGKLVYKWTIAPPARSLAPGASASFNSAEVNVPAGGDELTISVGPPPTA